MSDRTPQRALSICLLTAALVLISGGPASMAGDAPHYLAASDSIIRDGDLDLTNQYGPDSPYLFAQPDMGGHAMQVPDGRVVPFHPLGLSLLYAPVLGTVQAIAVRLPEGMLRAVRWDAVRAGRDLLSVTMAFLWIACALLTCGIGQSLGLSRRGATAIVAIAFLTPPLLNHSILILGEIPAALLTLWFVALMLGPRAGTWVPFIPLALLPWFHLRYGVIAVAGLVWWLARNRETGRDLPRNLLIGDAVATLSLLALLATTWGLFGTINPLAQYQDRATELALNGSLIRAAQVLFDPHRGLLVLAPFYALAGIGFGGARTAHRAYVGFVGGVTVATLTLAGVNEMWWGGYSPPARFMVPVLPLLVPLVGFGLDALRRRGIAWIAGVAFAWSLLLATLVLTKPIHVWSEPETQRGAIARLLGIVGPASPASPAPPAEQ